MSIKVENMTDSAVVIDGDNYNVIGHYDENDSTCFKCGKPSHIHTLEIERQGEHFLLTSEVCVDCGDLSDSMQPHSA